MAKILCLVPDLKYGSATTQLLQLATGLDGQKQQIQVVALRGDGPVAALLRTLQIPFSNMSEASRWDLGGLVKLRRAIKTEKPNVIHVWGLAALRLLNLAVVPPCPVLLSSPLPAA